MIADWHVFKRPLPCFGLFGLSLVVHRSVVLRSLQQKRMRSAGPAVRRELTLLRFTSALRNLRIICIIAYAEPLSISALFNG